MLRKQDTLPFPSNIKYMRIINSLPKLNLTTGNCGIFAFAIKEIFGEGKIIATVSGSGNIGHVLLLRNGLYYDGINIYTYKKFAKEWLESKDEIVENIDIEEIKEGTFCNMTVKEMKEEIQKHLLLK